MTVKLNSEHANLASATDAWKMAHSALEASIQRLMDANLELSSAYLAACHGSLCSSPYLDAHADMEHRIQSLASQGVKLRQAQSTAITVRDCHNKHAPINRFPSEILSHIFHLVLQHELRNLRDPDAASQIAPQRLKMVRAASYPNILSGVCKAWRELVLDTPVLWSYIDLICLGCTTSRVWTRPSFFVKRAGNYSLDVRIHPSALHQPLSVLMRWMSPVLPRIRSLDQIGSHNRLPICLLTWWATRATPGVCKKLSLDFSKTYPLGFAQFYGDQSQAVLGARFENLAYSLTHLKLSGALFGWNSKAYRRLVHLELDLGSIKANELRALLIGNPGLRVLSFGLTIDDPKAVSQSEPILLPHLHTLVLGPAAVKEQASLFQIIAPVYNRTGLKVSFDWPDNACFNKTGGLSEFLRKSKVTTLHVGSLPDSAFGLLDCMSHLRLLGLSKYGIGSGYPKLFDSPRACFELHGLCLFDCALDVAGLRRVFCLYPTLALRISNCIIWDNEHPDVEIVEELPKMFPDVKCNYRNVVRSWDPWPTWDFAGLE